jgi:YesN/AraC family two-component response regulator
MQAALLLRIDFTRQGWPLELPSAARQFVELRSIRPGQTLHGQIRSIAPDVICFDYDFPDVSALSRLRQIKKDFPSIPILMLTEHKSEELAVWALRSRVWDYFVKPLNADAFLDAIQQLHSLRKQSKRGTARKLVAPASSKLAPLDKGSLSASGANSAKRAVARAKAYVAENLEEKISAKTVATLCNMSPFHFSRSFKRICGMTFSEYVMETRIRKAIELLHDPEATITGVCFEVGFRDSSYFGRIFRRYAGMSPSQYLNRYVRRDSQPARTATTASSPSDSDSELEDATTKLYAEILVDPQRT